jgi:hypothetical protein
MIDQVKNCERRDKRKDFYDKLILNVAGIGGAIAFIVIVAVSQTLVTL